MTDKFYFKKEDMRLELQQALTDYKTACDDYGMSETELMEELDNTMFDAGLEDIKVVVA